MQGWGRGGLPDRHAGGCVHVCVCVCALGRTSARRPPGNWWDRRCSRRKTMVEREIQLVQGLVPISQPLNAKGAKRMGRVGESVFIAFSLSFWGAPSPLLFPQQASTCTGLSKESFAVHICHIHLRRCGRGRGWGGRHRLRRRAPARRPTALSSHLRGPREGDQRQGWHHPPHVLGALRLPE